MTLKTAYAPPCASSSMLQETGLETTNTWKVWQNPDAETVDSKIENARELIKRQEAELPPQKEEKAFNVSVGKHGEVTCIDSDPDDRVSNVTDME